MSPRTPVPTRRAPRALAALAAMVAVAAAGCSDGDDEVVSQEATTTSTPDASSTSTTSSTTAAPAATSTSTTTAPFDGGTARVEVPRPATTQAVVHHTALDVVTSGGEEQITFAFDGALPGVVVEYVDRPVRESGSGSEVAVEGGAVLGVRFEPAASARTDGDEVTRTYTGPQRVPGTGGRVIELVRTGDFEALYEWAVGVDEQVPFRVETSDTDHTVTVVLPAG